MDWTTFRQERQQRGKPFVVAHRGVMAAAPENTVRSFALAVEQGADALETDLRFTKDDEIILLHDATLERTTNGQGYARDYTLQELKALRTKLPDTEQVGDDSIPTLIELIQQTNAQTPLLLELKDPLFRDRRYARQLVDTLCAFGILQKSAIVSFDPAHVTTVEQICPPIPTGNITLTNPFPQPNVELLGPAWPLLYLNPFYVTRAHRQGAVVCPLDPTPERRMDYYLRLGVDAVLADEPAVALKAME